MRYYFGPSLLLLVAIATFAIILTGTWVASAQVSTSLAVSAACNGVNLEVTITGGVAPYFVYYGTTGSVASPTAGIVTLPGPATWTDVTVNDSSGNIPILLGNLTCETPLAASAACNGVNLEVAITDGDTPFFVYYGIASAIASPTTGIVTLPGPGNWADVTVIDSFGSIPVGLGDFTCQTLLVASAGCNGVNLEVAITDGDAPFFVYYGTAGSVASATTGIITLPGPGNWADVTVSDNFGSTPILLGDFTCQTPLTASAVCNGVNLEVAITDGDAPFFVFYDTSSSIASPTTGVIALPGPGSWADVTVSDSFGSTPILLGDFSCQSVPVIIPVSIDIKPGEIPNCINNDGHGVIPVAILGSATFDVTQVDATTVRLEGMAVRVIGRQGNLQASYKDVNGDGFHDLVVQIADEDGAFDVGASIASLTATLSNGAQISGSDAICIVPPE